MYSMYSVLLSKAERNGEPEFAPRLTIDGFSVR